MAEGISRRKYARLVSFLTETMKNERLPQKMRMQAALRLDDVYARNEIRADRLAERKAKAELARLAALATNPGGGAPARTVATIETEDSVEAEQRIEDVFDSVLLRPKTNAELDAEDAADAAELLGKDGENDEDA